MCMVNITFVNYLSSITYNKINNIILILINIINASGYYKR
jgi:hypothetical protein